MEMVVLPVRPRESLVIRAPVTANPTRKGQLRFHSRLKKTGHGSNFRIFLLSFFNAANVSSSFFVVAGAAAPKSNI